jgi:ribosomal protein S6--L-glutamate ligase
VLDLEKSIRALGHEPRRIYVDRLGIDIKPGRLGISQPVEKKLERVDVDGAFLRHLGIIKDYEQFGSRLWSVMAIQQSGVYVMNEVVSWLLAGDKLASLTILAKKGIPVPHTFNSEDMFVAYEAMKGIGEVVVKPLRGSMGYGVFRVKDPDVAMHIFSYFTNINKPMYLQRYLEKKGGGDYRVIVVGGRVIGAEFRKGMDWKSNIARGGIPTKAKADPEMRELSVKAAEALHLEYVGVDIAKTRDGYFVMETNPTMSWQGFKKVTGINVSDVLIRHLISKLKS